MDKNSCLSPDRLVIPEWGADVDGPFTSDLFRNLKTNEAEMDIHTRIDPSYGFCFIAGTVVGI